METQNFTNETTNSKQYKESDTVQENLTFFDLGLKKEILKTIEEQGFVKPTDIQAKSIPFLLDYDGDFIGQAQTGTGKTVAYLLPLLQKLDASVQHIQALILAPTRELANQVNTEIAKFSKYLGIKSVAVFGGASQENQIKAIKRDKPQVIVGTPGRLMDFIKRRVLKFELAEYVILDEADEMLNMGFWEDVQKILSSFKEHKYLWMFSATMPKPILALIKKQFNDPKLIKAKSKGLSNDDIDQKYYLVKERNHKEALCQLLDMEPDMYGLVFCTTKIQTKKLADTLLARGYAVESLHGDMNQSQRDYAMARFKKKKSQLMVCTDVAARGIDVNNLSHVINFGFPQDLESYVHRIGRTGRAGLKGTAIMLLDPKDSYRLRQLENMIKKKIPRAELPTLSEIKSSVIKKDLKKISSIRDILEAKGENFRLDPSFTSFKETLEGLEREDVMKIMFSWAFDEKLRSYDKLGSLTVSKESSRRRDDNFDGSKPRRSRKLRNPNNVRLFMNIGKADGIRLKEFLEDFSKQTGIRQNNINNIDFKDSFSFLEVPSKYAKQVISGNFTHKNRKLRFEYSH